MLSVIANRAEPLIFVLSAGLTSAEITSIVDPVTSTPLDVFDEDDNPVALPQSLTRSTGLQTVWYSPSFQFHTAGDYVIEVTVDGGPTTVEIQLEVLSVGSPPGPAPGDGFYATIGDVRAEGITVEMADDDRVVWLLWLVSREIDRYTDRRFGAEDRTVNLDGDGSRTLNFREPIVSITRVAIVDADGTEHDVESTEFRIYNRHLRQGLIDPDDRDEPKIEFIHGAERLGPTSAPTDFKSYLYGTPGVFEIGVQNVLVEGRFGYTQPDGTADGRIPDLIRRAATLLAGLKARAAFDADSQAEEQQGRLIKERTRDQEYQLSPPSSSSSTGGLYGTGTRAEAEVVEILDLFLAPIAIGAA